MQEVGQCYIEVVEQPEEKFRFRYKSEMQVRRAAMVGRAGHGGEGGAGGGCWAMGGILWYREVSYGMVGYLMLW